MNSTFEKWTSAAIVEAEKKFHRVQGWRDIKVLIAALSNLEDSAVAEALRARGRELDAFGQVDRIVDWVVERRQVGDVVLVVSNGAFGGIWEKLHGALGAAESQN